MDSSRSKESVDRYPIELIKRTARELVGKFGPFFLDREDMEQDLLLELWEKLPDFDPGLLAHRAYVRELVRHKAVSIVRDRTAEKRDYRLCACSLNERRTSEDDPGGQELQDLITEEQIRERLGLFSSLPEDQANLRIDVEAVLAKLPPDLVRLCRRLMVQNVSEISTEMGIARCTIYRRIRKLRSEFESEGFRTAI